MKIREVIRVLEAWAPPSYQESYDNARLIAGDGRDDLTSVLIALDCVEDVVQEAIDKSCNLIVAHHPIVFKGLKSLTGRDYVERTIIKAIKHDIAIYAIHTNLDNVRNGVNSRIADKIGLQDRRILAPKPSTLSKLVSFVPTGNTKGVLDKLYGAGAGEIGNYSHCSFSTEGTGTFLPGEHASPYTGQANVEESVSEDRIELMFPRHLTEKIITVLKAAHPYEEAAYYITPLSNSNQEVGSGMVGALKDDMDTVDFMSLTKEKFNVELIRHTRIHRKKVKRIALCGGAGSFLLGKAKEAHADIFITGDYKYHEFFEADNSIMIMDIGHYESEVFTKELIYDCLKEKIPNIAANLSEVVTNPVKYF